MTMGKISFTPHPQSPLSLVLEDHTLELSECSSTQFLCIPRAKCRLERHYAQRVHQLKIP